MWHFSRYKAHFGPVVEGSHVRHQQAQDGCFPRHCGSFQDCKFIGDDAERALDHDLVMEVGSRRCKFSER